MATYEIELDGRSWWFKNLRFSRYGHSCAQAEFDRLMNLGLRPALYRWVDYVRTLIQSDR
jgi:hypothetical protein